MAPRRAPGDANEAEAGGAKAAERFTGILTALAAEARPVGIAELAEVTGLPQATVHRLLTALVATGWVEKDISTARYRLGRAMLGPAAVALAHAPLLERGQSVLNRVAQLANATALLGVLVGQNVVYIGQSQTGEGSAIQQGFSRPAHSSATGKVLLAFLSPEERRKIYRERSQLQRFTDKTITDLAALERELEEVRREGSAFDRGEFRDYLRSVAVPIHDQAGRVYAGLACFGRPERMTPEHMDWLRGEMSILAEELSR